MNKLQEKGKTLQISITRPTPFEFSPKFVQPVHSKQTKESKSHNSILLHKTQRILREKEEIKPKTSRNFFSSMRGKTVDKSQKIDISKLYSGYYKYNTTIHTMLKKYKTVVEKSIRRKNGKPQSKDELFKNSYLREKYSESENKSKVSGEKRKGKKDSKEMLDRNNIEIATTGNRILLRSNKREKMKKSLGESLLQAWNTQEEEKYFYSEL